MKKIWTIILFFFVVLLLVGCQGGSKDVSEPTVTAPNETISGETEVITVDEIENAGEVSVTTDLELYFDDWGEFDLLALAKDLGFYSYDDEEDNLILFYRYLPDHTEDNTSYVELQLVDGVSLMNIWYTKDAMDEGYYDVRNVVLRGDVDDVLSLAETIRIKGKYVETNLTGIKLVVYALEQLSSENYENQPGINIFAEIWPSAEVDQRYTVFEKELLPPK